MTKQEIFDAINAQNTIILDRKAKLEDTDYKVTKAVEWNQEVEESVRDERQGWRDEINTAQEQIAYLESLEPEEEDQPIVEE